MYKARQINKSLVVTIPKFITEFLNIEAGDVIIFQLQGKKVIMTKEGKENE